MIPDPKNYDYNLPAELIAATHAQPRDHSRLMVVDRQTRSIDHKYFYDLPEMLGKDDVLVLNETKVFPARLLGKKQTGGDVEVLLLEQISLGTWRCISKPGLKINQVINFPKGLSAVVLSRQIPTGEAEIKFSISGNDLLNVIDDIGITPLPHYIPNDTSESELRQIYQTVYALNRGSAAAPTAGLHFTNDLLNCLSQQGVQIEKITLHVGLGTFQPLREENLKTGKLHPEKYYISPETSINLKEAQRLGKRIIAVGTTTARTLESNPDFIPGWNTTDIFIYPPYKFKAISGLITNFHLPQSSLLMMVTAFGGDITSKAYQTAISKKYRFYSFGDAMFIR